MYQALFWPWECNSKQNRDIPSLGADSKQINTQHGVRGQRLGVEEAVLSSVGRECFGGKEVFKQV